MAGPKGPTVDPAPPPYSSAVGQRDDLVGLAEYVSQRTLSRLEGITDEELLWQPVPGAWTVHLLRSGRRVLDNSSWPVGAPTITSIAWRVSHLIDVYASPRNAEWLQVSPADEVNQQPAWRVGASAAESVALLAEAVDHFLGLLRSLDDDALATNVGAVGGVYAESSLAAFVLHQVDEAIHHGAEVGVLRDLYAARHQPAPAAPLDPGAAADLGRWDLVESLVLDGADVNAAHEGRTALHQAAAGADLETVRFLLDHGADPSGKDAVFDGTPLDWALHFGRTEIAALLRGTR
jgi:hypothetical protein